VRTTQPTTEHELTAGVGTTLTRPTDTAGMTDTQTTPTPGPEITETRPSQSYRVKLERRPSLRLDPHPQSQSLETWSEWARSSSRPIAVDLFAGGGGLSYGLQRAGYRVGLAVDTDKWAVETHSHNFGGLSLNWDLSDPERLAQLTELLRTVEVGIVAGGPPCQPFSRAGRSKIRSLVAAGTRDPVDRRKDLWRVFLDVVLAVRPKAVLMENVPDMALGDEVRVVRQIVSELEAHGYHCNVDIRRAWEHGVPQHRQRLIVVATRGAQRPFRWPNRRSLVTVDSAIGDLPSLNDTTGASRLAYSEPSTQFQKRARRDVPAEDEGFVHDHVTRPVRDDDRVAFGLMDSSTKYSDLPAELRRYRDDSFDDKYKRLDGAGLSRTITAHIAKDGYWYIHPREPRTISVREAARIQTFPDSYRFAGPRSAAFKQIGNAVPPALAESIGRRIQDAFTTPRSGPRLDQRVNETNRVAQVQAALNLWADTAQATQPWRVPGNMWVAVINAVTSRAREKGLVQQIVAALPTPGDATPEACAELAQTFRGRTAKRAVERLPRLARHLMSPAEELDEDSISSDELQRLEVYSMDSQADRLVVTPGTARVATRVLGKDNRNRLTTGRLAVARLVGHGEGSQERMAAIIAIAEDVCFTSSSMCGDCPLAQACARSPMASLST